MSTVTEQLAEVQQRIRELGAQLDEPDYRAQFHEDLSPLGWHVGHCSFIETYWLREMVMQDDSVTAALHNLYFPENIPKPQRGPALPVPDEHLHWCETLNNENRQLLDKPPLKLRKHELSDRDYLGKFILQHHAQHLETMHMVLQQRAIRQNNSHYVAKQTLQPSSTFPNTYTLPAGRYRVGSEFETEAFDNEVPPHTVEIDRVKVSRRPVSNAEWLAFMLEGAYQDPQWWSDEGWQWCQQTGCQHPEHWQQDKTGNWFALNLQDAHELVADDAVYGINYYEACAYANWFAAKHDCQARLLHEYEWEAAAKQGLLDDTGVVWEWCENTFHPYAGFTPFPYDNYSKAWFDDKHYVLRGGSRHTCDVIRRHSFRNFYNPDKRHIFAGLRIAIEQV